MIKNRFLLSGVMGTVILLSASAGISGGLSASASELRGPRRPGAIAATLGGSDSSDGTGDSDGTNLSAFKFCAWPSVSRPSSAASPPEYGWYERNRVRQAVSERTRLGKQAAPAANCIQLNMKHCILIITTCSASNYYSLILLRKSQCRRHIQHSAGGHFHIQPSQPVYRI